MIFDKTQESILALFEEFCLEFGISSHLKKHGSSNRKIFRIIPDKPILRLEEVIQGKFDPPIGWDSICEYLFQECEISSDSCINYGTTLAIPESSIKFQINLTNAFRKKIEIEDTGFNKVLLTEGNTLTLYEK